MASLINALLNSISGGDQQQAATTAETNQTGASGESLQTFAKADDVQVKSVISSESKATASINNKVNFDTLLANLNTTHTQVDKYSQNRTAKINEQVQKSIATILDNIKRQQEELVADANRRHLVIDTDYKNQLQKSVEKLDIVKANALADLERELQGKQQLLMDEAKKQIDFVNDQANLAKLDVLVEAQEQTKQNINNLANQVGVINQQETGNLLQSKTTTVITSQTQAAGVSASETTGTTNNQVTAAQGKTTTGTSNVSTTPIAAGSHDVTTSKKTTVETKVKSS